MAVTYTNAKAALATIATALATEATSTGQTALATALTNLSTEISGQSVTEVEFFGGMRDLGANNDTYGSAALVWSDILNAGATAIQAKSNNTMATQQTTMATQQTTLATQTTTIAAKQTLIETHQLRLASTVDDITIEETNDQGQTSRFNAGPHVRNIASSWYSGNDTDYESRRLARGMMMLNLKSTNKLNELKSELRNPTSIL